MATMGEDDYESLSSSDDPKPPDPFVISRFYYSFKNKSCHAYFFLTNKIAQYFSNLLIDCLLVVTNVLNNNDIEIKLFLPGQIFTFKNCYCKKRFF